MHFPAIALRTATGGTLAIRSARLTRTNSTDFDIIFSLINRALLLFLSYLRSI